MAGRSTAQLQVSSRRFLLRRVERAVLCGSVAAHREPLQVRSALAVGCLLTALVIGGCAALALARPQPAPDGAPILLGRRSGTLYVRVDAKLHPVLNLASARLIAATDADPRPVHESALDRTPRGPLLGIPGAPRALGAALPDTTTWSVCDSAGDAGPTTSVVATDQPVSGTRIDPERPMAVSLGADAPPYLLYRGRRIAAARSAGSAPRLVSGLLLNAIPEAATLEALPGFPTGPAVLSAGSATLCVTWSRLPDGSADVALLAGDGLPLPAGAAPVVLAQADGAGPALDAVYLPAGRSAYVRSAGLSARAGGERYLVGPSGVRFPIGDDAAAHSLGLPPAAAPAPWPVLAGLPTGPQLSRQQALVVRGLAGADARVPPRP